MSTSRLLLPLVALVVAGACARPSFDAAAEGQKLLRRDAEWADLAAAGKDLDKIVFYWSDDAVVMEPGQPVYEGKAAIRAYVAESGAPSTSRTNRLRPRRRHTSGLH
jgi:hypothetical protein